MARPLPNPVGQKFNKLTVISLSEHKNNATIWNCVCECGKERKVQYCHLKSGHTQSCGCAKGTHKGTGTAIFTRWNNIRQRCYYPKDISYYNYGGRGVTMCEEWKDNFPAFREWAMATGFKKNLKIDRINPEGNYEPSNCRWVTSDVSARNTRSAKLNEMRVRVIKILLKRGLQQKKIAEMYHVSKSCIGLIANDKRWK